MEQHSIVQVVVELYSIGCSEAVQYSTEEALVVVLNTEQWVQNQYYWYV